MVPTPAPLTRREIAGDFLKEHPLAWILPLTGVAHGLFTAHPWLASGSTSLTGLATATDLNAEAYKEEHSEDGPTNRRRMLIYQPVVGDLHNLTRRDKTPRSKAHHPKTRHVVLFHTLQAAWQGLRAWHHTCGLACNHSAFRTPHEYSLLKPSPKMQ